MRLVLGAALLASSALPALARAEDVPTPYLDQIRNEMKERGESAEPAPSGGYIDSVRKRLDEEDRKKGVQGSEGYSEQLRREMGEQGKPAGGGSFTESEKARLGPAESGGAIQAVKEGRSELHAKREGEIHYAAGIRYGASLTRDITAAAGTGVRNFSDVYGSNYAPDLTLFFEYQPWHSEWYGNLAVFGQFGLGYYHGAGAFEFPVRNPAGGTFGSESRTTFQFFTLPATAGLDYRFNLFRILRPFVMAGPSVIGYYETRNDGGTTYRGNSRGVFFAAGASLLLDWVSGQSTLDLYAEEGVKHYYLTVDYSRLSTFSGDVSISVSGVYAGLTFEF